MNRLVASCGGVVTQYSIFADLVYLAYYLFSCRCAPKRARPHIRMISRGSPDITSIVISVSGARTSC